MGEFTSWRSYWDFERATKRHMRYVRDADTKGFLATVLSTAEKRVETIPSGRFLWRAQRGHAWKPLHQDGQYIDDVPAPFPPERMKPCLARAVEGRANPKGIPYLYVATNRETALAEVRPWIGSLISVGQFKTLRPLRVMNCTSDHKGSRVYVGCEPSADEREECVWLDIDRAFACPVAPQSDHDDRVWSPKGRVGAVLSPIVVSGQPLPGGAGTPTLTGLEDIDGPTFNNASTVGLVIRNGANTGVVLQRKLNGSLALIAQHGDPVPGGGVFDDFDDMAQNNNDDFAFIATYTEDMGTTFKTGVFLKLSGGPLTAIVRNGDTLPDTSGGTECGTNTDDIDGPWMNDLGTVAFIADAICGGSVASGSAFVKPMGMALQPLVLKGDPAPGGGTIDDVAIGRPGLNDSNIVGFKAEISGGSVGFAILTKQIGGTVSACVLGGSPAPGTTGTFSDFDPPAINQNGLLSIESSVTGDPLVSKGIFTCQNGVVTPIALEGDPKPGTGSTYGSDVSDASLSDNGRVTFVDEASPTGVFVNVLPAPAPAPSLGHWTMLGLIFLLVSLGVLRVRPRS